MRRDDVVMAARMMSGGGGCQETRPSSAQHAARWRGGSFLLGRPIKRGPPCDGHGR
jgi:hypothetical protein